MSRRRTIRIPSETYERYCVDRRSWNTSHLDDLERQAYFVGFRSALIAMAAMGFETFEPQRYPFGGLQRDIENIGRDFRKVTGRMGNGRGLAKAS